ncbi:MAG TPA: phospholipase D-like domain-containing protein [Ideonella sp.]|nr:phospholipase D-like domain-containing protein [Ideonella sp.]
MPPAPTTPATPPAAGDAAPRGFAWHRLAAVLRGLWAAIGPARHPDSLPSRHKLARRIARRLARRARFERMEQRLEQRVGRIATRVQGWVARVQVVGPGGRLSAAARHRLLAQAGSEGSELLARHLALHAGAGRQPAALYSGNRVELLVDGPAAFEAMFAAIDAARDSIFLESYIIEDAAIAQRLAALLLRKRAEGATVHVLFDAVGSLSTADTFFERLSEGGVAVCAFNPVNPLMRSGWLERYRARRSALTHRDHRKILVVDSRVAFTGGINISEVYSAGSFGRHAAQQPPPLSSREGWRDTQVRIEGPAALALEALVREAWVSQGCGGMLPPAAARPDAQIAQAETAGDKLVAIVAATPQDRENRIYATLLSAIDGARHSVHLTMAYFAPGQEMVGALCDAARRGVEVVLILPSVSDFAPVLHAGRSYYGTLLRAGVQVHELQHAVLHAKTAVIDGEFSTVGSSNMDWRSFTGNNEVNAIVIGAAFGADMAAMFERDLRASRQVTLADWQQRPWLQRAKERAARAFETWW